MDVREKVTNEKRLIDADALISYMDECSKESRFRVYYGYAKSFIDDAPTIDAVPVVRCQDCKYHENTNVTGFEHCCLLSQTVRYNDFCSSGKRKEGDDNG